MKRNRVGRLLVAVALLSWVLAGRAQAQTQLAPLTPDRAPVLDVLDQTIPPLPDDPGEILEDPPPVADLVDKVPPLADEVQPDVQPDLQPDVQPEAQPDAQPVVENSGGPAQEVVPGPANEQPSAEPSAVKSGGKSRTVAQGRAMDAAAEPNDLEEVATAGQEIAPGQVLSETVSAKQDEGPRLSRTGFELFDWIAAAALLMASGLLYMWASRPARSFSPSRA